MRVVWLASYPRSGNTWLRFLSAPDRCVSLGGNATKIPRTTRAAHLTELHSQCNSAAWDRNYSAAANAVARARWHEVLSALLNDPDFAAPTHITSVAGNCFTSGRGSCIIAMGNREGARAVEFYYDEMDRDLLVLKADGGLNSHNAEEFVGKLERLIEAGLRNIIVDCSGLDYISSFGIGVLIRLHKRLKSVGGDVKLAAIKSKLIQVLSIVRLDQILDIYPDVNRARLAFRPVKASVPDATRPADGAQAV